MEEEISGFLGKHISMLSRFGQMFYDKELEEYGIGSGQQFVLLIIWENPGIYQIELAEKICIDKGTITKAVKKLVNQGYVVRQGDTIDKRINRLYTTSQANEVIQATLNAKKQWQSMITEGIEVNNLALMERLMCFMAANALKYTQIETHRRRSI